MIPIDKLRIGFEELALRGAEVLKKQKKVTHRRALEQVKRLRRNSRVNEVDKKK